MIRFKQSAQAFEADNLAVVPHMPGFNDSVDILMNPFIMVVGCIMDPAAAGKRFRQAAVQGWSPYTLTVRQYWHRTAKR